MHAHLRLPRLLLAALGFLLAAAPAMAQDAGVKKLLDENGITYEIDSDNDFKLLYDTGNGRSQLVFVRSSTYEYNGQPIREVMAFAYRSDASDGALPAQVANRLLEYNATTKVGAWEKRDNFAVFVVKIRPDASWEVLNDAYELVLRVADEMEEKFTGLTDEF